MDLEKIKELIEMLETSSLYKLQLKNGEEELVLEKESPSQAPQFSPPPYQEMSISPSPLPSEVAEVPYTVVVAPLVGIYYESSSPESPPFIKVGSRVKVGDTLCIIEAMKVLNEIKSPVAGEVKAIHVKNGDILSYDQTLIEIGE